MEKNNDELCGKTFLWTKSCVFVLFFLYFKKSIPSVFSPASTKYTLAKQQACSNGCSSNITLFYLSNGYACSSILPDRLSHRSSHVTSQVKRSLQCPIQ